MNDGQKDIWKVFVLVILMLAIICGLFLLNEKKKDESTMPTLPEVVVSAFPERLTLLVSNINFMIFLYEFEGKKYLVNNRGGILEVKEE